jgi:hypothetical protein
MRRLCIDELCVLRAGRRSGSPITVTRFVNYKDTAARNLIQIIFKISVRKNCAFHSGDGRFFSFQLEFNRESDYQRGA